MKRSIHRIQVKAKKTSHLIVNQPCSKSEKSLQTTAEQSRPNRVPREINFSRVFETH